MATKNKKQTTLNSPPPTTSSYSSSSPPLADRSTPRTKSAPPHPVKKNKNNGFRRNVNDVLRRTSVPRATATEEEEEAIKLPKYDQLQTQLDAHAPTIPSPVQDVHAEVELPKQNQRSTSMSQTVPESLFLEDKLIWGEDDEFDLQSLEQKAEEELYKRPKKGETYEAVNVELIEKRLKHLSNKVGKLEQTPEPDLVTMIDEGLEIADSVSLLKIKGTSSSKVVEMAGQKAHKAATLIIQSQIMFYKARELLAHSKDILQAAEF